MPICQLVKAQTMFDDLLLKASHLDSRTCVQNLAHLFPIPLF